jgi:hypothetical protein
LVPHGQRAISQKRDDNERNENHQSFIRLVEHSHFQIPFQIGFTFLFDSGFISESIIPNVRSIDSLMALALFISLPLEIAARISSERRETQPQKADAYNFGVSFSLSRL